MQSMGHMWHWATMQLPACLSITTPPLRSGAQCKACVCSRGSGEGSYSSLARRLSGRTPSQLFA